MTLGGTLGHALCTGLAVIGGRLIAQKISVKTGTQTSKSCFQRGFDFLLYEKIREHVAHESPRCMRIKSSFPRDLLCSYC